ncbi:30S ribosomal protein S15 [Candidatus Vidania fulgoroideorum]
MKTGTTKFQMFCLKKKIKKLKIHLKKHKKDLHNKRGFLNMLSKLKKIKKYAALKHARMAKWYTR